MTTCQHSLKRGVSGPEHSNCLAGAGTGAHSCGSPPDHTRLPGPDPGMRLPLAQRSSLLLKLLASLMGLLGPKTYPKVNEKMNEFHTAAGPGSGWGTRIGCMSVPHEHVCHNFGCSLSYPVSWSIQPVRLCGYAPAPVCSSDTPNQLRDVLCASLPACWHIVTASLLAEGQIPKIWISLKLPLYNQERGAGSIKPWYGQVQPVVVPEDCSAPSLCAAFKAQHGGDEGSFPSEQSTAWYVICRPHAHNSSWFTPATALYPKPWIPSCAPKQQRQWRLARGPVMFFVPVFPKPVTLTSTRQPGRAPAGWMPITMLSPQQQQPWPQPCILHPIAGGGTALLPSVASAHTELIVTDVCEVQRSFRT